MAEKVQFKIQHTSMEFSDSVVQHRHDAKKIFDRAVEKKIWACTGTEAGGGKNHDLRDALIKEAKDHNFAIHAHQYGEWVAMNRRFLEKFNRGYAGPFIPAEGGKPSGGSHAPRGVAWMSGRSKTKKLGRITVGAAHYLTDKSEQASKTSNEPLIKGIAAWAKKHGEGSGCVFLGADANTNDKIKDVFGGRPLTTAADELKDWQGTHGPHSYIDVIASYNYDARVKAQSFTVLDDKEFVLYTDHYLLQAVYTIAEMRVQS